MALAPSIQLGPYEVVAPLGGRALLMPAAPTQGREPKIILDFDEVIRRKMEEARR